VKQTFAHHWHLCKKAWNGFLKSVGKYTEHTFARNDLKEDSEHDVVK